MNSLAAAAAAPLVLLSVVHYALPLFALGALSCVPFLCVPFAGTQEDCQDIALTLTDPRCMPVAQLAFAGPRGSVPTL